MSWTIAVMAAAALVLWLALLYRLLRLWQKERAAAKASAEAKARQEAEEARRVAEEASRKAEAENKRKREAVKQVLAADPILARSLSAYSKGKDKEPPTADNNEAVHEIAARVPAHVLQILQVAAAQKDIEFDLQTKVVREKAGYPTNDIEPTPMARIEQIPDVLPEQMMLDDDNFYRQMAHGELIVLQPYERLVERKTLMILLDLSSSMKDAMGNGLPRHSWSRGITVNLLLRAVRGEATYLLRGFAGAPYDLHQAASPAEAQALIARLLATDASGQHTDILRAIRQGAADVRERKAPAEIADVLIITDGEDASINDSDAVLRIIGRDVRLHVASIGKQSPALQAVAHSYQVFI